MMATSINMRKEVVVIFLAVLFFDAFTVSGQSPTVTFRARKHNDTIISSNPLLGDVATVNNISPGDTVEIDIFLSDWGDAGDGSLRGYQIIVEHEGFVHDADLDNLFLPVGWDAPAETVPCLLISRCSGGSPNFGFNCCSDVDCVGGICEASPQCPALEFPICNECPVATGHAKCTGLEFDPPKGAFIKEKLCSIGSNNPGDLCELSNDCPGGTCIDNTNYILNGISPIISGVNTTIYKEYSYGGLGFLACIVDTNPSEQRYAGTLILEAKSGAVGTFNIEARQGVNTTFVVSCNGILVAANMSPVTINMTNPAYCSTNFDCEDDADGDHCTANLCQNEECVIKNVCGACCNSNPGTGGICVSDTLIDNCQDGFMTFSLNTHCEDPDLICEEVTGACCDRFDGFCQNFVLQEDCAGTQPSWVGNETCATVICDPALGACCNTRFGTCTENVILADCSGQHSSWTKQDRCNTQTCPDPFIPTVSQWGLVIITLMILIAAKLYFGNRYKLHQE